MLRACFLGRVGYAAACQLQEELRRALLDGRASDTLLLLEHPPTITLGRSAAPHDLLCPAEELARLGIGLAHSSRGGAATYHGPGQLVGYPVVRLLSGVREYVLGLAAGLIDFLRHYGIEAHFEQERPGLYVDLDVATAGSRVNAKIAAFGVHVHRQVAVHGFALNLNPDLGAFARIVPCGQKELVTTSLAALLGDSAVPPMAQAAQQVGAALASKWQRRLDWIRASELPDCGGALELVGRR